MKWCVVDVRHGAHQRPGRHWPRHKPFEHSDVVTTTTIIAWAAGAVIFYRKEQAGGKKTVDLDFMEEVLTFPCFHGCREAHITTQFRHLQQR